MRHRSQHGLHLLSTLALLQLDNLTKELHAVPCVRVGLTHSPDFLGQRF